MTGPTPGWIYGLNDPLDETLGDDKLAHLFGAAALWAVLAAYLGPAWAWILTAAAIAGVEAFEAARYQRWAAKGFPMPWPWMRDKASLKDVAAGLLGAALMALALRWHS